MTAPIALRPYQTQAITDLSANFRALAEFPNIPPRVLVVAPTGGGKTVIASKAIQLMTANGKRVVFLAHRRELIQQTQDKLSHFGVPAGVIMAGFRPESALPVQVASIQTLARRALPFVPDYLFVDECHHITEGNAYGKLLESLPTTRVVGLTATPFRLDGRGLADIFPRYVVTRTPAQLRAEGFLAPVAGLVFRSLDTSGVETRGGDFIQSQLAATENTILGDVVQEWLHRFRDAPVRTILFAAGVKHSKQFVAAFRAAGVAAEHVDGETPTVERDAILARVRAGTTLVLSNCNVATEGFDLPELTCCILARPTKSLCMYLQQVGRILRPAPGKHHAIIHDHANCLVTHGTPYDESREYVPFKTAKKRDTGGPNPQRCPQCGIYTDDKPCPDCGYMPAPTDRTPTTVTEGVTAVSIDDLEQEQTVLSDLRGSVSFRRRGDAVIGILERVERTEGIYGPVNRYHFTGLHTPFYIDAPSDLHAKLRGVPPSTRVRIVFKGTETTARGFTKKLFGVYIPMQLPTSSASTVTDDRTSNSIP